MTDHTPECLTSYDKWLSEKTEYERQWPNYCRNCRGWGYIPAGYEYGAPILDPCDECVDQGRCPRCNYQIYESPCDDWEDGTVCPKCGWHDGVTEGIVDEPECWCWINEEQCSA